MIVASISFRLPGGMRLIRSAKRLEQSQINARLEAAKQDDVGCQFCYMPENVKSHTVDVEEQYCTKEVTISKEQYNAITRATYDTKKRRWSGPHPSTSALREAGLSIPNYIRSSEYTKLMVYFSDLAHDYRAISYKLELFPV